MLKVVFAFAKWGSLVSTARTEYVPTICTERIAKIFVIAMQTTLFRVIHGWARVNASRDMPENIVTDNVRLRFTALTAQNYATARTARFAIT